ncbi:winged helix-turn-helix transcriptional regulator [Pedobacter fastidiosus]|uniref:Helix-turn-helix transcriptional regulator n=1 Tax=Pedobacter fastidiosus TaxID=2765361 RepID=A0ABR7KWJ6_9SPHI|nr:helix-turn-helix domain-containing protein [Pedobacter fastidiosus]MBC6112405.1 helix-turn-helix transcriptional regulator [Pedobacter fastidiosus]
MALQEEKKEKKYYQAADCPITLTVDIIGGKWKPLIIWLLLKEEKLRFGEITKLMPGIALKVLSRSLKELQSDGILVRKAYPEVPPRVEYSLSAKGESLRQIIDLLSIWSRDHVMVETV